jgi:hypothetical protein
MPLTFPTVMVWILIPPSKSICWNLMLDVIVLLCFLLLWQITERNNLQGVKIYFAPSFRDFSPCLLGYIAVGLWWGSPSWWRRYSGAELLNLGQLGIRDREEALVTWYALQMHASSYLLPLARSYLLKSLAPPKIVLPVGDQAFII